MTPTLGRAKLHPVDIGILVAVLAFSVAIGIWFAFTGGRQRTTKEYLVANRRLSVIPVALSMFMSFFSAIYILGGTAETYKYGVQTWLSASGFIFGYIFICIIFIPLFYPLKLTSAFEYVDLRFKSRPLRVTITLTLILNQIMYMGVAMFAPGTALEAVTGFPLWASIVISGLVTTFYTTVGGMKAVVWTDAFQGIVMFLGLLLVVIFGSLEVGGLSKAWHIANDAGRINFFNFDPDPTVRMTFWPLFFGSCFKILSGVGTAQAYVQRYCALPTISEAKQAMLWCIPLYIVLAFLIMMCGLVMFAYYQTLGCDPLRAGVVSNPNQLLPYFVLNVLPSPGLAGLFISVLYSGALSSVSSSLSSLSAVTWKDLMEPHFKHLPERRKAFITKILVFLYGCTAVGFSFLASILPGHVMVVVIRLGGSISSPIKGIMLLGCLFPFGNWKGAIVGALVSLILTNWMNIGAFITVPHREYLNTTVANCTFWGNTTAKPMPTNPPNVFWLYRISFLWVAVIGSLVCIGVGVLVSYFTNKEKKPEVDPRLMIPLCDRVCCFLPKSVRQYMWCGVDYDRVPLHELREKQKPLMQNGTEEPAEQMVSRKVDHKNNSYEKLPVTTLQGRAAGITEVQNGQLRHLVNGRTMES